MTKASARGRHNLEIQGSFARTLLGSAPTTEGADTALYVGDDLADEDVFQLDQPGRLLAVRVGESAASSAGYYVRDQKAVDSLLAKLVMLGQRRKAS